MKHWIGTLIALLLAMTAPAPAQDLSALARLDPLASIVRDQGAGVAVDLRLSQPVPWRVRLLDNPPRLVLDAREIDWAALDQMPEEAAAVTGLRAGVFRSGWSRLVLDLAGPLAVTQAEMQTGETTVLHLALTPVAPEEFARLAAAPEPAGWALPEPALLPAPQAEGAGPVTVVLDPGHGGLDPGAENGGAREADLMLTFARELKEALLRDGGFQVVLTRTEDVFVPLETRISIARAAGADVFLSLHADALAEGEAQGATIYRLSDDATDEASAALAERHDRDDLLAGVDLTAQDDLVATVLMDMARAETDPRIDRLALALEGAIKAADLRMHRHARQEAGFSVLKSPDIPSVLLEVGFLSSTRDLERLQDKDWRARMAAAVLAGLTAWAAEDATIRALRGD